MSNVSIAKKLYLQVTELQLLGLREISRTLCLSISSGDLTMLEGRWYVTHSGLLRIATRRRCKGIENRARTDIVEAFRGALDF